MKKFIRFLFFVLLFFLLLLIYGRYVGTDGLVTKEYTINTNIDESFNNLKIVHFSDLHYLRITDVNVLKNVVDEINLINPDIVFFTGDLIDKDFKLKDKDKDNLINMLSNIKAKYGKYAIIGNHDHIKDEELFKEIYSSSGFSLLQNNYDIIYGNNNDKLFIGGTDTYTFDEADISKIMEYFKDNEDISYKIILCHEPDYIDKIVKDYDIDLVLSGHSHNGQINIPFIKKYFLPKGSRKYYDNYYKVKDTDLYVSSGIGVSRLNLRMFNKPSINFYRINKITE